ncbi:MAG: peptidyl-prolyl cis-trans isomerase [Myxococcaceae bacterium]
MARFLVSSLAALALLGCQKGSSERVTVDLAPKGTGTPVAKFNGGAITVEDINRQLAALPPMVRLRLQGAAPKKDFVEGQVRVELLAREAVRNGLQNDPEVVDTFKKTLAQKALLQALEKSAPQPTDEEIKVWYENHQADFQRPAMIQLQDLFLSADSKDAARRKSRLAEAEKLRAKARGLKPDDEAGFAALVKASSDDALTKSTGGDLRPMPLPDLQARYGAEVADAAKALKTVGEISPVVTTDKGFHILRLKAQMPAHVLPLDDVKAQIRNRMYSERRTAASDELMNRLKTQSGYTLDEAALAQIAVPAPTTPGTPGGPHGGMPGMPGMQGAPRAPTPGPPAAPGAPPPTR